MLDLTKQASLHEMRYKVLNREEGATSCQPAIDDLCDISLTWYTDDYFPEIEPYYSLNGSGYSKLSGICGNTQLVSGSFVMEDFQCTLTSPGLYQFQLHKNIYDPVAGEPITQAIAESVDLEILDTPRTPILFTPGPIIEEGFYTISWSQSQNATRYVLQEARDNGSWETIYDGFNLEKHVTHYDGATYSYRVQACNGDNCSLFSPVSQITTIFNCSNSPNVPSSGDFIQEMESSVEIFNRSTTSVNNSIIPDVAGIKIPETYVLGVPNEKINILNASVTYEYNDIVIPGSNGLDLIVKRELGKFKSKFQMVSKIEGFKVEQCNTGIINEKVKVFIEGKELTSVGFASSSDLPLGTLIAFRNGHVLKCNENDFPEVVSPNGMIYTFEKTISIPLHPIANVPYHYYVTEIKDVFDNTITFNYGDEFQYICSSILNLESMSRNDGAQIDFEYELISDLPYLSKANYGDREVKYFYEYFNGGQRLTSYIDQGNRETVYEYYPVQPLLKKVSTPTGLQVEYEYASFDPDSGYNNELTHRKISGPDILSNTISYIYGAGDVNYTNLLITQRFDDYALIRRIAFRDSAPIDPYGAYELSLESVLVGTIKSDIYFYDSDPVSITNPLEILYSENKTWVAYRFGGEGCPQINDGQVGGTTAFFKICARPLLIDQTYSYQVKGGEVNSYDGYINEYSGHDKFGFPNITKQSKVNSTTDYRYFKKFYYHDSQNWILGQPTITQVSSDNINWTETTKNGYWPATHSYKSKLKYEYLYGQQNKYYQEYHVTGDLKRVNVSGTNAYEIYSNYKRGIAQTTTIPNRYSTQTESKYLTVNDFGEITSQTNYIGITTDYFFDKLGRTTLIDYNECDVVNNCTLQNDVITYNDTPNTITTSKGNYNEIKTYDSLFRIKTESKEDTTDITTKVTNSYSYGINGNLDYQSFPSNASLPLNGAGNGIEYKYDFLNRKTQEIVFDSSRTTVRDFEYLKDNIVRYTDGKNNQTTIEYLSYGNSTFANPLSIIQQIDSAPTPTYVTTSVSYDLFDNISSINQGGMTETRLYDSYQQLCKVVRPDVGITAYGYYSSGLLSWKANGTTGSTAACGGETSSDKISFTYNNQNELWAKNNIDGNIQTITTNIFNNIGSVTNLDTSDTHLTLTYNKINQLVTKDMDVAPFNNSSPGSGLTSWGYNDMGYVNEIDYPESNSSLSYSTNALGQVTSISEANNGNDYFNISNVSYHSSGGLLAYTLGNGITRSITRKNSGLPEKSSDMFSSIKIFEHSYLYDNESNLTSLIDGVESNFNLTGITYDGLNRLKSLNGNWGPSNFNYDNLSNITQMKLGSQTLNYVYGPTSNRLESTTGSALFDFQYDSSGNITNNGIRTFDYDKQNRLVSSQNVSFIHDGEDLIHSKAVVGEPTKYSLYGANQDILFKFDSDNHGTVYYYLNESSVANVKITSAGRELTYQHNDALGSLSVETDVSGNVAKRYHYEPYGFTLEAGQEDSPGFTGQIYDDDLGLNYMKARYYDPMIGRFYSNDPIGFELNNPMSFNRYSYANNNPYKYVDKTGENIVLWIGGIGSGVIDFVKGEGFNKDNNLTDALGDGYTNGDIGGALLEDATNLVPVAKAAKVAGKVVEVAGKVGGKVSKFFKKLFGRCCFVAGTQVLTKDGYKNIEDIKLTEMVWAKDVETSESDWKSVIKIYVENDRGIYSLKLAKPDGEIINIQTTDDHPFYVVGHGWKTTIELLKGDFIETKEAGNIVVVSVEDEHREDTTYNFEIADFHTFYVTKYNVLVHNGKNCNKNGGRDSSKAEKHGDGGRAMKKALERNKEIDKQIEKTTGKTAKNKLKKTKQNNIKDAQKKDSGINDNNRGTRN